MTLFLFGSPSLQVALWFESSAFEVVCGAEGVLGTGPWVPRECIYAKIIKLTPMIFGLIHIKTIND